jgi:alpha-glucosidase (family GH31 glycosyl hydrolase)
LILQKAFTLHTQVDGVTIPPSLLNTSGFDASNDAPDIYIFLPAAATTAADTRQNTAINSPDSHVAKAAEYGYAGLRSEYLKLTGAVPALPDEAFGTWFSWCECDRRALINSSSSLSFLVDMVVQLL